MEREELKRWAIETGHVLEANGYVAIVEPAVRDAAKALLDAAEPLEAGGVGWLALATGGTGGALKLARHDESTLAAAAAGFQAHFDLFAVNAVDVLPAYHVSGFLARVRCRATGGLWLPWDWKRLEAGEIPALPDAPEGWVLSLVPTQLQRLLERGGDAVAWLKRMRVIFLGGGPAWPGLLQHARREGLPLSPCYGMTETAAMVAALLPQEFKAGRDGVGRALPHARLEIVTGGERIQVTAASLFRGYVGQPQVAGPWLTSDLGAIDAGGFVEVKGRDDDVIITGGRKVSASRLEGLLKTLLGIPKLAVLGLPDERWGQRVVVCVPKAGIPRPERLAVLSQALAAHEIPKSWLECEPWPEKSLGKVDRVKLSGIVATQKVSGMV